MILVTGGSGSIGSHAVRALHERGETSLLVQRRTREVPAHLADLPVAVAVGDVTELASLLEIGSSHDVTGSCTSPATTRGSRGPVPLSRDPQRPSTRCSTSSRRPAVGRDAHRRRQHDRRLRRCHEDMPVLLWAPHPIPRSETIDELLAEQLAEGTGTGSCRRTPRGP